MEDLFGINARRQAVAENIEKAMTVGFTPDEELERLLVRVMTPVLMFTVLQLIAF